MASSVPLLMRVIANSVTCAARAGMIIKETLETGNLKIVEKGINDLQTEADRNAQRCIISSLNKNFPNIVVIGEECLDERTQMRDEWIISDMDASVLSKMCPSEFVNVKDKEIVIWVDPLDGTSDYTQGFLNYVTVLIGIAVNGKAIAGVIHQPFYNHKSEENDKKVGRTIWGLVGLGAFGHNNNVKLTALPNPINPKNLTITTSGSHGSNKIDLIIKHLQPQNVIRAGGAGYKILLVLEGIADSYFFPSSGCKRWDTCSGEAILKSVGGCLTDINGSEYNYDKNVTYNNLTGVVASKNLVVHKRIIDCLPSEIKRSLTT